MHTIRVRMPDGAIVEEMAVDANVAWEKAIRREEQMGGRILTGRPSESMSREELERQYRRIAARALAFGAVSTSLCALDNALARLRGR